MIKTEWRKEMDKQYKKTIKNWRKTGTIKKQSGINAALKLGNK